MFSAESCRTCKYFRPTPEDIDPTNVAGFCCITPDPKAKKNVEWCGQFRTAHRYFRIAVGRGTATGAWNLNIFGASLYLLARVEREGAALQVEA